MVRIELRRCAIASLSEKRNKCVVLIPSFIFGASMGLTLIHTTFLPTSDARGPTVESPWSSSAPPSLGRGRVASLHEVDPLVLSNC